MKIKIKPLNVARYLVLVLFSFITLYPFSLLIITSLKTQQEYMRSSVSIPAIPQFINFKTVWESSNIIYGFYNSFSITFFSLLFLVIFGSLAAYALTKMNFDKAKKYQLLFLAPMILPIQIIAIPLYLIYSKINLTNSRVGLIIVYIATGLPLVIFIMTSFMKTIPYELNESAMLDGASQIEIFGKIILPLLKPVLATVAVISGLSIWNDFFMPLLLLSDPIKKTLPLQIYNFMGQYSSSWPLICACILYVLLPIFVLYIFLQKYIVQGVVAGAIKG